MKAATIIDCELPVYDQRVQSGLTQLAKLLPQKALATALGDAMACRTFSGLISLSICKKCYCTKPCLWRSALAPRVEDMCKQPWNKTKFSLVIA